MGRDYHGQGNPLKKKHLQKTYLPRLFRGVRLWWNGRMNKSKTNEIGFYAALFLAWAVAIAGVSVALGSKGIAGVWLDSHPALKLLGLWVLMAHVVISCMSISFHRSHTHQAVKLSKWVDYPMQVVLWVCTSMSKLDWVSVHVYHHAHSDTPKDPHSPAQKGLLRVFFLGVFDYSRAKSDPEVLKIRSRIPRTAFEAYLSRHLFQGPMLMGLIWIFLFGPFYGTLMTFLIFLISPVFAVGGVNALAHAFGYQNYDSKDESRNLGFLFLLNWVISGELDHNNHHKFPKSPSFAHRWFEFDIGWVYIRIFKAFGLARVTGKIPAYNRETVPANSQSEVAFVA